MKSSLLKQKLICFYLNFYQCCFRVQSVSFPLKGCVRLWLGNCWKKSSWEGNGNSKSRTSIAPCALCLWDTFKQQISLICTLQKLTGQIWPVRDLEMLHSSKCYLQRQPGGGDAFPAGTMEGKKTAQSSSGWCLHKKIPCVLGHGRRRNQSWCHKLPSQWGLLSPELPSGLEASPHQSCCSHYDCFSFLKPILVLGIKEKTGCVCTGFGLLGVLFFSSQCHLSFMILLYMDSSTEGPVFSGPYAMWQK